MDNNSNIIKMIFGYEDLNRDEKYLLLAFEAVKDSDNDVIEMPLKVLEENLSYSTRKVVSLLKELKNKGYIEIIKRKGTFSIYRLIKKYKKDTPKVTTSQNSTASKSSSFREQNNKDMISKCPSKVTTYRHTDSDEMKKYSQSNRKDTKHNNKYLNNKIYINILNIWNSIDVCNEQGLNPRITDAITNAIEKYSEEDIAKAIQNYKVVYHSRFFYNYRWNLVPFLNKVNGIERFLDNGDMWLNYKNQCDSLEYDEDFDIQSYID